MQMILYKCRMWQSSNPNPNVVGFQQFFANPKSSEIQQIFRLNRIQLTFRIAFFHHSLQSTISHHTTTTVLWPFFRDHPGEPVLEENFWILWCKGRLTEAETPTIRLGATPSALTSAHLHHLQPLFFYRLDALHAAQPTVSKHRRQLVHSD